MNEEIVFYPVRVRGTALHLAMTLLFLLMGAGGVIWAGRAQAGLAFLLALVPVVLGVILAPILAYRAYALLRARYALERDGIRLQWGWRTEVIPVNQVLWVESRIDVENPPPLPAFRLPGAVVGQRILPSGQAVEYLADSAVRLVLIATPRRIFGISPADPREFVNAFQRFNEMGSLTPLPASSSYPGLMLWKFWGDFPARMLFLSSVGLCLALLVWVGLAVPNLSQVSLRLTPAGESVEFVPAVQLLLLPLLSILFFLVDTVLAFFFYRREETRPLVYLLWGSSGIVSILFMGAVFFILKASS